LEGVEAGADFQAKGESEPLSFPLTGIEGCQKRALGIRFHHPIACLGDNDCEFSTNFINRLGVSLVPLHTLIEVFWI